MAKDKPQLDDQTAEVIRIIREHNRTEGAGTLRDVVSSEMNVTVWRARKLITQAETIMAGIPQVGIDPSDPLFRSEVARRIKKATTVAKLAEKMNSKEEDVTSAINDMEESGYIIVRRGNTIQIGKSVEQSGSNIVIENHFHDKPISFGVIADMHLCSKAERLDVLNAAYDEFAKRGITTVFCPGNYCDGECRFNTHELLAHGIADQCQYCIDHWPSRPGIKTYFVDGDDHEGWFQQREGIEFGRYLMLEAQAQGRDDLVYLGYMEADFELKAPQGSAIVKIIHAGGGSSYAFSYASQKLAESFQGGEKPSVCIIGHYHKQEYCFPRNVHCVQAGCFSPNTTITTDNGDKRIRDIGVGDMVLTHMGRYRPVSETITRQYNGDWTQIIVGRRHGKNDFRLTAEHPVLIDRDGIIDWIPAHEVVAGDLVATTTTTCKHCNKIIPWYRTMCTDCNPADDSDVASKISIASQLREQRRRLNDCELKKEEYRELVKRTYTSRGNNSTKIHYYDHIIPVAEQLEADGYRVIPIGVVVPDIIAIKDGQIIAVEVESHKGKCNTRKYDKDNYGERFDDIVWVKPDGPRCSIGRGYRIDNATRIAWVPVVETCTYRPKIRHNNTVYNLEVEEDNSYFAKRVAVHNCTQDQTRFMRKRKLAAHVGFCIVTMQQDIKGSISRFSPEFFPFWDRGYYLNRDGIGERLQDG